MTGAKKNTVGQFYEVSKGAIQHVAAHSNRAAVVLAYLALKRYQQRGNLNVTTGGRPALAKVLNISQRRAACLLDELRSIAWGKSHLETAMMDAHVWNKVCCKGQLVPLGHPGAGKGSNKVMPSCGDDFIYLPNSLTEVSDQKKHSPLGQLYHLRNKEIRLHATMLLLALYDHLDMQQFGGVDPAETIYVPWRNEGKAAWGGIEDYMQLGCLGQGPDNLYYLAVDYRADDDKSWSQHLTATNWKFIESITGETKETTAEKFWSALRALQELGLVFHAAMVFDSDPLTDPDAEVLYPLWTFNKAEKARLDARGCHEGGLGILTAKKAARGCVGIHGDAMQVIYESNCDESDMKQHPTGWFIAAADTPDAKVLGIMRPRFIPNTMDGHAGWASIRDKSADWGQRLSR